MAYFYLGGDRDQLLLLPMSMRDWLEEGHLAWFVIDLVDKVDTAAFHARHPNDGPGRPAYDPEMMLALLFYADGTGVRSSRRVEAACRTDAAYRVICAGGPPRHATIARFLVDHQAAIEAVFVDVLRLCAAAGLVSVGRIAMDGTKIGADAALDKNRDTEWIRAEVARILAEARATDATDEDSPSDVRRRSATCPVAPRQSAVWLACRRPKPSLKRKMRLRRRKQWNVPPRPQQPPSRVDDRRSQTHRPRRRAGTGRSRRSSHRHQDRQRPLPTGRAAKQPAKAQAAGQGRGRRPPATDQPTRANAANSNTPNNLWPPPAPPPRPPPHTTAKPTSPTPTAGS